MKKQAENAEMMQKIYQKTPFLIYIG
jgi:hypothetical protein